MHYYSHNVGDYRRDTSHLSLLEHGVYRQMMDTYYLTEKPLPLDHAVLMRTHCARNANEAQAIENVLKDFFVITESGYIHKRCDVEIEAFHSKSVSARESAKARWDRVRAEKEAEAMRTHSEGNANHKPITNNQEQEDQKHLSRAEPLEGELLPDQRKNKRTADPALTEAFASFWKLYPKKVSKADAVKAWNKIKPDLVPTIMHSLGLHRSCEQWTKDEGQFIPNAATWLNKQKWEDEVRPHVERAEAGRKLSAVELVAARGAERERARQGNIPEYFGQGEFLDGEYSRTE
jgi:uncharacterized protein YdaU (DUF1376 family)